MPLQNVDQAVTKYIEYSKIRKLMGTDDPKTIKEVYEKNVATSCARLVSQSRLEPTWVNEVRYCALNEIFERYKKKTT